MERTYLPRHPRQGTTQIVEREPSTFADFGSTLLIVRAAATLGTPFRGIIYQPTLELLDELRPREIAIGLAGGAQ